MRIVEHAQAVQVKFSHAFQRKAKLSGVCFGRPCKSDQILVEVKTTFTRMAE